MHPGKPLLRRATDIGIASLLLILPGASASVPVDVLSQEITILRAPGALLEGSEHQFVARVDHGIVTSGTEGYLPPLPTRPQTRWEPEPEFVWAFGDGTGPISSGAWPSVTHTFADRGEYTVRVEVRFGGETKVGTETFRVGDRRPIGAAVTAVEVDAATSTFELEAVASTVPDDDIVVEWDFGDGSETVEEERPWTVRHEYASAGIYTATATFKDSDGGEPRTASTEIRVFGPSTPLLDEDTSVDSVVTGFQATMAGSFGGEFRAEVRPLVNIFLGPVDGDRCRFMFTAWDPANLAYVGMILDLPGLPDANGGRYTFRPGNVVAGFSEDVEQWNGMRRVFGVDPVGFGERALAKAREDVIDDVFAELSEDAKRVINDQLAGTLEVDPRERQPDLGPPPATSPWGLDEDQSFRAQGGQVEMLFVPREGAIGAFALELENSNDRSPHQALTLTGSFAIDLEAAVRDGLFLYNQCNPERLAIEDVWPEDDTRHLFGSRPRVTVRFSDPYDLDTLDESTFQLTYPEASTGQLVPVPARIVRSPTRAYLVPEEDLWGGVRYTARVKTGDDGVSGRSGVPIEDEDDSGWYSWDFTPRLDLEPDSSSLANLSCRVYQTIRDPVLIRDKPAWAAIDGQWDVIPEVAAEAQTDRVEGRFVLEMAGAGGWVEIGSTSGTDRFPSGIERSTRDVRNPAVWIPFTPDEATTPTLRVAVEVGAGPGGAERRKRYYTLCSTPVWNRAPELVVEFFGFEQEAENLDLDAPPTAVRAELPGLMDEVSELAVAYLPLQAFDARPGEPASVAADVAIDEIVRTQLLPRNLEELRDRLRGRDTTATPPTRRWCDEESVVRAPYCAGCAAILEVRARQTSADLVVGVLHTPFAPSTFYLGDVRPFSADSTASIFVAGDLLQGGDADPMPRWVLHFIGHYMGLTDAPGSEANPCTPDATIYDEDHYTFDAITWHAGIDGMPMRVHDGAPAREQLRHSRPLPDVGYGASIPRLVPMMYRNLWAIDGFESYGYLTRDFFILRQHYVEIQRRIEEGDLPLADVE